MTEEKTRKSAALSELEKRSGGCVACVCERYELTRFVDGFATCTCGHTRWGHKKSFVEGCELSELP